MSTVSVVIPTYNRSETLPRAIDSVLEQEYESVEVIVVDDHSSDETPIVAASYDSDLTYIRLAENRGGAYARNMGIKHSTGDYIAFLDDDDEWHDPTKLRKQVAALESLGNEWIGVYCGVKLADRSLAKRLFDRINTERDPPKGNDDVAGSLLMMDGLVHGGSTLLLDKDAVTSIGGFDESFSRRQDVEFVVRLTEIGKIDYIDDKLVTLYDTPGANPKSILQSQELLIDKFSDRIPQLERQGYDIQAVHNLYMGRQYLRKGNLQKAVSYLRSSSPSNFRHSAGLALDGYRGAQKLIWSVRHQIVGSAIIVLILLTFKLLWNVSSQD